MTSELFASIFLNRVPHMTPARFRKLIEHAGTAADAIRLTTPALLCMGIPDEVVMVWGRAFRDPAVQRAAESEIERADRGEFVIILESDTGYPELLRELPGRPPVLYSKGLWPIPDRLTIGVVGTRHPSPYGLSATRQLTDFLVRRHVVIVSGLALGIDRVAHDTTLKAAGHTVGILGHGFGSLYPRQNTDLYNLMAERGTLLTEFPFESGPNRLHFPQRNRIISGLSRGVLVVEAGTKSGALITARYAAEQGRDVFAVPGQIDRPSSVGCHRLIKEGAKLIECAEDILEEYAYDLVTTALESSPIEESIRKTLILDPEDDLTSLEKTLLETLFTTPFTVDELAVVTAKPVDQLMNALLSLELQGRIRMIGGQRYAYNS